MAQNTLDVKKEMLMKLEWVHLQLIFFIFFSSFFME